MFTAAMSEGVELLGSTSGEPKAPGARLPPVPAAPPAGQNGWVEAKVMLAASVARTLLMCRILVPNWSVWRPLVQVKSSTTLWTGMWNFVVNEVEGEAESTL